MRTLFLIMLILVSAIACKNEKDPEVKMVNIEEAKAKENTTLAANYTKAEFTIEGMSCAMGCAAVIEKNLSAMEGVKTASVNFEEKVATVEYNAAKVSPEDLALTVTTTGDGETYKVTDMRK